MREIISNSIRYWETRRVAYNAILAAVLLLWVVVTWPHFRPAFTSSSLLIFAVLALLANLCYCAAYLIEIPAARVALTKWTQSRWILWIAGTMLAVLFENYWIADEIYPFVH